MVGTIDDAIGKVPMAFLRRGRDLVGLLPSVDEIFKTEGLPHSVYSDCHSISWTDREPTLAEQLQGKRSTTEVGRALAELGITLIPAGSPQAKGRIERLWGTFQDPLVSELRLAGAKTRAEAQAVLEDYMPKFNRTFSKTARKTQPAGERSSLTSSKILSVLSINALWLMTTLSVSKEHCFRFRKKTPARSYAGKRINVHVLLDGSVEFFFKQQRIARFDFKTAHASGLYRTNTKRDTFRYGPLTRSLNQPHKLSP